MRGAACPKDAAPGPSLFAQDFGQIMVAIGKNASRHLPAARLARPRSWPKLAGNPTETRMYASREELDAFLESHPEVEWIDALIVDLCGQAIGKRLPRAQAAALTGAGTPVCAAMQLVDVQGNTADPMGHGFSDGDPDGLARALPGGIAEAPWTGGRGAQALCQLTDATTGAPFWYDPREVLARTLARFGALGLTPVVALELEFYLLQPERGPGDAPLPARSPFTGRAERHGKVLSLAKLDEFQPVIDAMQGACAAQGIPATTMISEYGPGQFEINLAHGADILRAADDAALLRRAVTGAARAAGHDVTFMSKPFPGDSGSGLHVHLSLLDAEGRNVFDPALPEGEATLGRAVAGLQRTMHEAMAVFAPNINVYRRFKPDEFTPVTRDWGENNRSVAFRLPAFGEGAARRLEHRVAGAEANPYLVTAAVLAGVHHGLSEALEPSAKHGGNAGAAVDESLPLTLWDALSAFRAAEVLPGYFGADYMQIYAEVKQAEFESFLEDISPREYRWYL
jgi:glutamine synthetase